MLNTTAYPTKGNGVTYGWVNTRLVSARNRNAKLDPRLAGINFVSNGAPGTFYVDLPSPGTYNVSLAMGDAGYGQCSRQCQVQFLDGSTVLATVTTGVINQGYFYDAKGNNWSAAAWPSSNLSQQVTLTGSRLTVVVGTNKATGDVTPIAFLGVAQVSGSPNFTISASPAALSVAQGNQGTSTISTAISGGFNSAISLSASGLPTGTTVSFNPNPIPAPGGGNSTMTITVGSSTPTGTYPITVTGNGGGAQQSTTVNLTITTQQYNYDAGIDFRGTQNYVSDPAYAVFDNCVNDGTNQQTRTNSNGYSVTWQWSQKCNAATNESASIDPRLAGIASVYTASGGETLTITVPQAGIYNIGFATGNAAGGQCGAGQCPNFIFKDGASGTQLFTVNPNNPGTGHFIDAANHNWTAAQWPANNQEQVVTLTGTTLTVSMASGNAPSIAHVRVTYAQQQQNFSMSASPNSLTIQQGNQGTSTITTTISGGFDSAISLSASGAPSGTTVSFSPGSIPAPGNGSSTMTITVGSTTPTGTYPITVTGNGGGVQQNTTVTLTVTAAPNFTISASPASLSVAQGNQGTSMITSAISGGFNSAISLSASGVPSGTTVSFNPQTDSRAGCGQLDHDYHRWASTPTGTYPITVTGNGGGIQQNTTVTLTVTAQANFTISASPASLSIQQGNQGTSTISTAISGGFNSAISLSASGVPSGTTVSFNPQTIPAPGSGNSTMTVTVGANTPMGTYPITVTGNGGGIQQTVSVTLTVTAQVALSWTASSSPGIAGYNAYRSINSNGPYIKLNGNLISTTSYNDQGVHSGNTYYYVTTAVDSQGTESAYSNQAVATVQ